MMCIKYRHREYKEGTFTWGTLNLCVIKDQHYKPIATNPQGARAKEGDDWFKDARRITACLNAMIGVPTETLEAYTGNEPSKSVLFRAIDEAATKKGE